MTEKSSFHTVVNQLFVYIFFSIDEDSNSESGIQSPPDCAPPTSPAISVVNDVIKSESHDNIFSTPKFGSELKRRASDVSLQSISSRPASLNLNYSQRGAPGKEKSKKVKPVKTKTYKFHEFKVKK